MTHPPSVALPSDTISLVIPTYTMADHLEPLWESIQQSKLISQICEVIFVDDASTDSTPEILSRIQQSALTDPSQPPVRILRAPQNQGRFLTRYWGARESHGQRVLFMDTRITLPAEFGEALAKLRANYSQLCVCVDIDIRRSVYCLYWDRSHRVLFRRHYRDTQKPLPLTPQNFDQYLSGTTTLLCLRELFIRSCKKYESQPLLNDDVALIKDIIQTEPLVVHPELRIQWVPRETALEFLKRLWERGPSFVEYHVFGRRKGSFFWITLLGTFATAAWFLLLWQRPDIAFSLFAGFLGAVVLSTSLFAHGLTEFFQLVALHTATVFTFGLGILRGLGVQSFRVLQRRTSK